MISIHTESDLAVNTLYINACCVGSRDIYSCFWDGESDSAGVLPSMTGIHGREEDDRSRALPTQ